MIERIHGQIVKMDSDALVLMVGGVGVQVRVPRSVLNDVDGVGTEALLYTYLIVREDELTLYGFTSEEERAIFTVLITVNGVGPRLAAAILGTLSVDHLRNAVGREEPEILTRVPGIGKKIAQKIIFELKDKMRIDGAPELMGISDTDSDVLAALTALGYSVIEAQTAIQAIPRDAPDDVETRVLLALQYFS